MANLPAVAADGATIVYLKSFGAGTDLDPYVPGNALIDDDGNAFSSLLAGTKRTLTVALVDDNGDQILNFGGDATAANQVTLLEYVDGLETAVGAINETAPANDTASSGLNGRLQRIAQRLTSLINLLPSSLGIKTAANSLSVAPASDGVFATYGSLTIPPHDYISNTWTSGNLTQVVYKTGGSGGTTVATLTLTYDGSNNLLTVTKA